MRWRGVWVVLVLLSVVFVAGGAVGYEFGDPLVFETADPSPNFVGMGEAVNNGSNTFVGDTGADSFAFWERPSTSWTVATGSTSDDYVDPVALSNGSVFMVGSAAADDNVFWWSSNNQTREISKTIDQDAAAVVDKGGHDVVFVVPFFEDDPFMLFNASSLTTTTLNTPNAEGFDSRPDETEACTLTDGRVVFHGGFDKEFWIYDPADDSISEVAGTTAYEEALGATAGSCESTSDNRAVFLPETLGGSDCGTSFDRGYPVVFDGDTDSIMKGSSVCSVGLENGWDATRSAWFQEGEVIMGHAGRISEANQLLYSLTEDTFILVDETPGAGALGNPNGENATYVLGSEVTLVREAEDSDFLTPDQSVSMAGDAQEVAVSDHLLEEDVRVFAKDRGGVDTFPRENNLHRYDAGLTLLNERALCDAPDSDAYFLGGGLAITEDNFPVTVCRDEGFDRPLLFLLNQDLTVHPEGSHVVLGSENGLTNIAAETGNKVVWANSTGTAQGESDIPNTETVVEDRLVVDVDVDWNSSLVLGVGDGGVWVENNVSGSLVVEDGTITGHTAGVIGSNDSKEWVWLGGDGASVERYEVGTGSLTLNGSFSSGVSPHTVALSPDARYLVVVGNGGFELVDADGMTVLNETFDPGTTLDLRSAAMDACNNYVFVVAGDGSGSGDGEVLRYPVHQHTSCEGFGGTDSTGEGGVNEPAEGTQSGDGAKDEETTGQDGEPLQDTGTQDIGAPSVVVETGQSNVGLEVEPRDSFRVWVRDRGDPAGNHTRVRVFDSGLGLLHDRFACTGSGTYESFQPWTGLDALSATSDGQGLVACEHVDAGVGLGLFLLGEDGLPESGSEFDDFGLIPDAGAVVSVSARSAADVVFTGRSATTNDERVCQKSFSALVSSVPCRFLEDGLADVHISKHPDLPWVVFSQGGWGTGVDEEIGGDGILPRSGDGHTSVRIDGDAIFSWTSPPGSGELERWEVEDRTMVRTHVRSIGGSSAFPLTEALGLSPEGQVLALIETGEISVRRADNLDALAVLEGMADARGVAVGPSLERVYAINETHVAAWDVADAVSVAGITAEPVGVETFAEATAEDEEDEDVVVEPVQPGEDGIFGDGIMQIIADGFGVNQFGARAFVAGALITGFALSGASIAGGAGAAVAAAGATVLAFGGGLLPLWLLLGLFLIGGGLLVFWRG